MERRNYWRFKTSRIRAFTLLESLVVSSCYQWKFAPLSSHESALGFRGSTTSREGEQKEWLLFVDQLEGELNRAQFEKSGDDRLYLKQDGKPISMGKSKSMISGKQMLVDVVINPWSTV